MADHSAAQQPKTLIYLYGVTAAAPPQAPIIPGVDGLAPLETVTAAGVTCWFSRVPAAIFGDALARNMENLEWLAEASVRHQGAVAAVAAVADVLPARFGTIFRDQQSLLAHVTGEKRAIAAALKRISGADEWGVKVFAEPRPAAIPAGVSSGKDYLRRKAALLPSRTSQRSDPELAEFGRALADIAEASARGGPVSAGQRHLVWQGAFLVRRDRRKQWQAVLRRFASKWGDERRIECTGPWPPYSFASSAREP